LGAQESGMIPSDHLAWKDKEIKPDTAEFLNNVLLALLNVLKTRGIDTRDVELLGTNDIYVLRGTNFMVLSFSRSTYVMKSTVSEFSLADILPDEGDITIDEPSRFENPHLDEFLRERACVAPVNISFPISYLSQEDAKQLEEAHRKVAMLLVEPAEEDVDRKRRIVRVNPIYEGRNFLLESDLCFVLMEFRPPFTDIYEHLIKPTVEDEGFRCLKSDDIFTTTSVIEDIWANINKAGLIIAEISSNNPNVMYELGVCHTVGKNVMMITQDADKIPFNFRHMRCYSYKNDIPGSDELKKNIRSVIQHLKATQPSTR
jgi:hypothetical protein